MDKLRVEWKNGYVGTLNPDLAKIYEGRDRLRILGKVEPSKGKTEPNESKAEPSKVEPNESKAEPSKTKGKTGK